jgi:hypothetical protein
MITLQTPLVISQEGNILKLDRLEIDFEMKLMQAHLSVTDTTGKIVQRYNLSKQNEDFEQWYNEVYISHRSAVESFAQELNLLGNYNNETYV